jgi:hypothetical protein
LSDTVPIQNCLKSRRCLINIVLVYSNKKVQEKQAAFADDINLSGDNTNTTEKNTEALTLARGLV